MKVIAVGAAALIGGIYLGIWGMSAGLVHRAKRTHECPICGSDFQTIAEANK